MGLEDKEKLLIDASLETFVKYNEIYSTKGNALGRKQLRTAILDKDNNFKYFTNGGEKMLREKLGAKKSRMVAKIAGGAKMFAISSTSRLSGLNVGDNNIESARLNFKELGIDIIAEDVGLNYGRTIEFYAEDGRLVIKSVGKEIKVI